MQFFVTAYDYTDDKAIERRMAVREEHLELVGRMAREKKQLFGAALLDDSCKMIGSILVYDFPSQDELEEYLKTEPYVTGKVWETIQIKPCKVPPVFLG